MTLPWDATVDSGAHGEPWTAEQMQPDSPIPAVATNYETGQQVRVDIGPPLKAAIQQAINDAVGQHPVAEAVARKILQERPLREVVLLHGAAIDITVAIVAALSTIVSPTSTFTAAAWVVAAVLAVKTLIQTGVTAAAEEVQL